MCLHTLYNPDAKGMLVFKDLLLLELSDDINQIKMQQEFTEINRLEKRNWDFPRLFFLTWISHLLFRKKFKFSTKFRLRCLFSSLEKNSKNMHRQF